MADSEQYTAAEASDQVKGHTGPTFRPGIAPGQQGSDSSHEKTARDMMLERGMGSFRNNAKAKYGQ